MTEWNRLVYQPAERWAAYYGLKEPATLLRLSGVWWELGFSMDAWGSPYADGRWQGRAGGRKPGEVNV